MRIVSLAPGATDILVALGLGEAIVGVGHDADILPLGLSVPVLTRGEDASARLDEDRLIALAPDVIFARGDADGGPTARAAVRRVVARMDRRPPVYALAPTTVGDVLSGVKTVGDATGAQARARELLVVLRSRIDHVTLRTAGVRAVPRVVCLEACDPPRAAGLWVPELVGMAGGYDALTRIGQLSRPTTWDEVAACAPEILVVLDRAVGDGGMVGSPDRASFAAGRPEPPVVLASRVVWVEAAPLARPGPRLVDALERLAGLLHPEVFDDPGMLR